MTETAKKSKEDGIIYVGSKFFMRYIDSVRMQIKRDKGEVTVKGRGKFISKVVDIAESYTKRFSEGTAKITEIRTNTEDFTAKDGKQLKVSTIEIDLKRI